MIGNSKKRTKLVSPSAAGQKPWDGFVLGAPWRLFFSAKEPCGSFAAPLASFFMGRGAIFPWQFWLGEPFFKKKCFNLNESFRRIEAGLGALPLQIGASLSPVPAPRIAVSHLKRFLADLLHCSAHRQVATALRTRVVSRKLQRKDTHHGANDCPQ